MIQFKHGNLLEAKVDALVNTVNTEGIMGKGIALQFKKAFPDNFKAYAKACKDGKVRLGDMFIFDRATLDKPRFIVNFPTKGSWKQKSNLRDIESGLNDLVEQVGAFEIQSIAIPPLGSGLGGLSWGDVRPLIEKAFQKVAVQVLVYEPTGAPAPADMINRTTVPNLTTARAAVLALMKRYRVPGYDYRLSLLEIQKLAYFLQEAGQQLKLNFEKQNYGPYADNLRHVLNVMESHYISGYGEGKNKPETPIRLLPLADMAEDIVDADPAMRDRFRRVASLIEGFETPDGMELLSTVHWVIKNELNSKHSDVQAVVAQVHKWSERKKQIMPLKYVEVATQRLVEEGWA